METIKLKNGLTIYLLQDFRRHSTYFQFTTFCGGITKHFKYDGKEYFLQDGVAHILEHYIVECNKEGNFLEELGKMQMNSNASTTITVTSFYFETVENVSYGIEKMLKGIHNVTFKKNKLEKLKNPIYQEIRGKLDSKFYHLAKVKLNSIFQNNKYRDIGGELEEVEKTTIKDLKLLYDAFYQPKNEFIIVAGNFNKEEVLKTIKNFYKNNPIQNHKTEVIEEKEPLEVAKKEDEFSFPSPEDYIDISFKIKSKNNNSKYLMNLDFYLYTFLYNSFGIASPLYKKLVDQKIISESIRYGITLLNGFYIITIGTYTSKKEIFKEEVLKELKERKNLNKEIFELERKKSKIELILRDENIFKMTGPLLNNIVLYHYPYLDTLQDIDELNYEDYKKIIQELDFSHYTCTTILKK